MASSEVTITVDTGKLVRTLEAISRHAAELAAELTEINAAETWPKVSFDGEALGKLATGEEFEDVIAKYPVMG